MKSKDHFAQKAESYDTEKPRTRNVDNIAQAMLAAVPFTQEMRVMDFGSGTGLLLSKIAPHVSEITAVDVSPSMNEVLQSKIADLGCKVEIMEMDLTKEPLSKSFDAVISSMTMHHIEDVSSLFEIFYSLLDENGIIAIADLDKEDGSFHSEDTGVFHLGFEWGEFTKMAANAGFVDLKMQTASVAEKSTGEYPVFLLTGKKQRNVD